MTEVIQQSHSEDASKRVAISEPNLEMLFQELDVNQTGEISVSEFGMLCRRLHLYLTAAEMQQVTAGKITLAKIAEVTQKSKFVTLRANDGGDGKENQPVPFALQRIKSLERKQSKTHELKSAKVLLEKTGSVSLSPLPSPAPCDALSAASGGGMRDSLTSTLASYHTTATATTTTTASSSRPLAEPTNLASPLGGTAAETATERSDGEPDLPKLEIRRVSCTSDHGFPKQKQKASSETNMRPAGAAIGQPQYLQASQTEKALGSGRTSLLQNMMAHIPHPSISPRIGPIRMFKEPQVMHQDSFTMLSPRTREELAKNQLGWLTKAYEAFFGHKEVDQFPEVRREYRPQRAGVYQDMDLPLSHYFISSGHNSYLKGNQLTSASSTKPIADALDRGCRVIELDVWSGAKEPYVVHGFTMSKKVLFSRCIKTVRKHAFRATDFPLIITLENHCNARNKERMVKILLEELGDMLYRRPKDQKWSEFPSPNELRGYILIRDKHDNDFQEIKENIDKKAKSGTSMLFDKRGVEIAEQTEDPEELKDLISIVNVKHSVAEASPVPASSSRGEASFDELNSDLPHTLAHTQTHLLRTYPGAKRLDSSNYDPMLGWGCGAQIVALNWQTPGTPMWAYQGMFRDNGHCGYVKKPDWMLGDVKDVTATKEPEKLLRVRVLSARHMRHRGIKENNVTLEMFGIGKDSRTTQSAPVKGYDCCTWDQEFTFPLRNPDCAVLLFTLRTKERFRGQVAIPINNLAQGKFQMHLLNKRGQPLPGNRRHTQLVVDISLQKLTGNLRKMFKDL